MNNVHFAIPEIYGDSLSYYDLLSKLVKAMNTVIENYNTIPDQIAEEVKNLDASQLFSAVLNQLIHSIATDNTKSANAVKVYKKHDLLYATFNETVNLYESIIDFTSGTETELIVGTNIREVNISELFIELRKLIDINKNNIEAVTAVSNENSAEIETIHGDITAIENKNTEQDNEIATIHGDITAIENKNTEQDNEITTIHGDITAIENKNTEQDNEITTIHGDITAIENKNTKQDNELNTLRTMLSTPYNFKGEVASISALPSTGNVNDTYYVQDVKYKVTWTGSAWVQSSLSEADYQTELSRLSEDLDFLNGHPLEYSMTWIDGGYIDSSNGDLIQHNGWHYTDYIELENNDDLYVSTSKGLDNEYNAFYDSNKSFIRNLYISGNSDHEIINYVPQNAKYVRLSCESEYSINMYPITTVADLVERVTTLEADCQTELSELKSDLLQLNVSASFNVRVRTYTDKRLYTINGDITSNSGLISKITDFIPCEAGDVFKYKGYGSGSVASVAWYKSDKTFLSANTYNSEIVYTDITTPTDAQYVRFASYKYGSDASAIIFDLKKVAGDVYGADKHLAEIDEQINSIEIKSDVAKNNASYLIENAYYMIPYDNYPNEKLVTTTGNIATNNGLVSKITDFISCIEGQKFKYKGYGSGSLASVVWYDNNKNYISGETYSSNTDYTEITVPLNASYARFASCAYGSKLDNIIFDVKTVTKELFFSPKLPEEQIKPLNGKKWIAVGDSLTSEWTLGTDVKNYTNYVSEELGLTMYNKGVGGTGYWKGYSSNSAFYQRVNDFTETADIVTIFGSFNDLGTEDGVQGITVIGDITDNTTDTICGCINKTLDTLEEKYPLAMIAIITPTPWSNSHDNTNAETYVSKLKGIAKYRSIPCLDLYHESSMRPWDEAFRSNFYQNGTDGAHPNTEGHKRITPMFVDFIKRLIN